MNRYRCTVSDNDGRIQRITRTAFSSGSLLLELLREGFHPVEITRINKKSIFIKKRLNIKVLMEFTAMLSALTASGVSIRDGMEMLESSAGDRSISKTASIAGRNMRKGDSFSSAMESIFPNLPPVYSLLLKTAEETGEVHIILEKLSVYLKETRDIREKLLLSALYPSFILVVLIFTLAMVSFFIIPRINSIFADFGIPVPSELRNILIFSRIFPLLSLPVIAGTTVLLAAIRPTSLFLNKMVLSIPLIGIIIRDKALIHILFAIETLISRGISIKDSLSMVANSSGNILVKMTLDRIVRKISKGERLSEALYREKIIPEEIHRWIAVGEKTGAPGRSITVLSEYFRSGLNKKTERIMNAVEPALIVLTGIFILFITFFVFIPLFSAMGGMII